MSWISRNSASGVLGRAGSRGGSSGSHSERVEELLSRALAAALAPDRLDEVEACLGEIVRADSDATASYFALAELYRRRREVGRAIHIHQNLLLRQDLARSDRLVALAGLAQDYRQGGFQQRALATYEEVLTLDSRHMPALDALVDLYAELGDHAAALKILRRLERAQKHSDPEREAQLLVAMATRAHGEGRSEAARKTVKRALRRNSECLGAAVLLGRLEAERGRDKAALAAWQGALEKGDPGEYRDAEGRDLYSMVAASFAALDRAREYEGLLRSILATRPNDLRLVAALAEALASWGELPASLEELRMARSRDPKSLGARRLLVQALLDAGRREEVLSELPDLLDILESHRARLDEEPPE